MNFDLVSWLTSRARQTLQYKVEDAGWQGQRWCGSGRRWICYDAPNLLTTMGRLDYEMANSQVSIL